MSGSALRREVFVVSSGKHDQAEVRSRRSHAGAADIPCISANWQHRGSATASPLSELWVAPCHSSMWREA